MNRDRELDAELQTHLDQSVRDHMDRGLSRRDAEAAARREFGNLGLVKEVTREMWGWASLERLAQDLRYGMRVLAKSPAFTVVAVLTLALGIGANTALFSIVNGVLLTPLPFADSSRLVSLFESKPNFKEGSFSYPNFLDFRRENHSFDSMAAYRQATFTLTGSGEAERFRGMMMSAEFFHILGVQPLFGRLFNTEEDRRGQAPVALISEGVWKRRFGASPSIVGSPITLNGTAYTVIGIIPANFRLAMWNFRDADVYALLGQSENPRLTDRSAAWGMNALGRLRPGVALAAAGSDLNRIAANLAAAYPDSCRGIGVTMKPMMDNVIGSVRPVLLMLLAAVGFVLLIACVNVANLLLARANARVREFALRSALGASRLRMLRQALTESVLLAVAGGTLGLLFAAWGTSAALRVVPRDLPRAENIHLDSRVLLFTFAISILTGLIFGIVPALRTSHPDLNRTLQEGGRVSGVRQRAHGIFVMIELALALMLLVGAGLMIRTLQRLWSLDPGFNPHQLATASVALPHAKAKLTPAEAAAEIRELHRRLAAIPGIRAVSLSDGATPMWGDDEVYFWLDGEPRPAADSDMKWALDYIVEPDWFPAMGIQLLRGRLLTDQDNENSPPHVVVDEEFANKFYPGQDPVGKRINTKTNGQGLEIVGVVRHVNQWGLGADPASNPLQAQIYLPILQLPPDQLIQAPFGVDMMVRSSLLPAALTDAIRRALSPWNNQIAVYGAHSMEDVVNGTLAQRRFAMIFLAIFAALALLLATIGIYGVVSYAVGQRTHEIGIRMALGAQKRDVLAIVLGLGARLTAMGVAAGVVGALALSRLLQSMLWGVRPTDPLTFAAVVVLLSLIAIGACYLPARRAVRVDPLVSLRHD